MNILITGGTGFIGKKLGAELAKNHRLFLLVRDKTKKQNLSFDATIVDWAGLNQIIRTVNIDSVVNLAGEQIAQRWNERVKRSIMNSRVDTTARLVKLFKDSRLQSFISASAIGYYGDRDDELLTEESISGVGFLTRVCFEWEKFALKIKSPQTRVVIFRFGMVLGKEGGAIPKMISPFKVGLGGPLGDGKQWMSWIHIDDLINLITLAINDGSFEGIYNAVSPNPVTNRDFSESLARAFNKKLFLPVPKFALKIAFGEMSQAILGSQRVQNTRLQKANFKYNYPEITGALKNVLEEK